MSPRTTKALDGLKAMYPTWREEDLIEAAVEHFYAEEEAAKNRDPIEVLVLELYSNAYNSLLLGNAEAEAAWRRAAVAVEEAKDYDKQGI